MKGREALIPNLRIPILSLYNSVKSCAHINKKQNEGYQIFTKWREPDDRFLMLDSHKPRCIRQTHMIWKNPYDSGEIIRVI
jgi:hypothetical protein